TNDSLCLVEYLLMCSHSLRGCEQIEQSGFDQRQALHARGYSHGRSRHESAAVRVSNQMHRLPRALKQAAYDCHLILNKRRAAWIGSGSAIPQMIGCDQSVSILQPSGQSAPLSAAGSRAMAKDDGRTDAFVSIEDLNAQNVHLRHAR